MKKLLSMSIIVVSIGLAGFSVYNSFLIKNCKNENSIYKEALKNEKQFSILRENKTFHSFLLSLMSSNLKLENLSVVSESGSISDISKLIDKGPKMVLRYSEVNCMSCVDSSLNYLLKYVDSIGDDNIIVLASYKKQKDIFTFKRINNIESFEIFNLNTANLNLPIENEETPYYFVIDENLYCHSVFRIDANKPKFTEMYFKMIISRYFPNQILE